jgi:hypothetical protein
MSNVAEQPPHVITGLRPQSPFFIRNRSCRHPYHPAPSGNGSFELIERPDLRVIGRFGLWNLASSESLPGVCPDPQRQGALDAEHRGVGPHETRPLPSDRGRGRARRACDTGSRPIGVTGQSEVIR